MEKKALENFIEKELSYDATISLLCPKCEYEEKHYWIDHKESLATNIAQRLGIRNRDLILDIVEDVSGISHGKPKEDAREIVSKINTELLLINENEE